VEYHLLPARDLAMVKQDDFERLQAQVIEVERMLTSLVQSVRPSRKEK
jgi:hypothetical protein